MFSELGLAETSSADTDSDNSALDILAVLEMLRGVSVNSLADRVLAELHSIHGDAHAATDAQLQEMLAELEAPS